jgi:hypothetical protein
VTRVSWVRVRVKLRGVECVAVGASGNREMLPYRCQNHRLAGPRVLSRATQAKTDAGAAAAEETAGGRPRTNEIAEIRTKRIQKETRILLKSMLRTCVMLVEAVFVLRMQSRSVDGALGIGQVFRSPFCNLKLSS